MIRIRVHGRGGHGIKTASRIVGRAAFRAGFHVQDSPIYGAERRGAAIAAFTRIASEPILERGVIAQPGIWPLKEAVHGAVRHTYIPNHFRPVVQYLEPQRRFRHLFKPSRQEDVLEEIQANVDAYWRNTRIHSGPFDTAASAEGRS